MDMEELKRAKAPFDVIGKKDGSRGTVIGFKQNDPLGVGGGIFPDMPVAYFEDGGWLLVSDLLRNYELAPTKKTTHTKRSKMKETKRGPGAPLGNHNNPQKPKRKTMLISFTEPEVYDMIPQSSRTTGYKEKVRNKWVLQAIRFYHDHLKKQEEG